MNRRQMEEVYTRIQALRRQIEELESTVRIGFEASVKEEMIRGNLLDEAQKQHLLRGLPLLREEDKAEFLVGLIEVQGDVARTQNLLLDWLATIEALEEDLKFGKDDSEPKDYQLS